MHQEELGVSHEMWPVLLSCACQDAGMLVPVPSPCSSLLSCSTPGTCINCSCFPSLILCCLQGQTVSHSRDRERVLHGTSPPASATQGLGLAAASMGGGWCQGPGWEQRGRGHGKGLEPFSAWNLSSCFLYPLCWGHELGVPLQCMGGLERGCCCPSSQGALGGMSLLQELLRVLG